MAVSRLYGLAVAQAQILCLKTLVIIGLCFLLILSSLSTYLMVIQTRGLDMKTAHSANVLTLIVCPRCLNWRYLRKVDVTPQSYLLLKQTLPWPELSCILTPISRESGKY